MKFRNTARIVLLLCLGLLGLFLSTTAAQDDTYTIPAAPEGLDITQIIASVGDQEITLDQFRQRVRFERWRYYRTVLLTIERNEIVPDPGQPLIFPDSILAFVDTAGNPNLFGPPLIGRMMLEAAYRQEAAARGITISTCDLDTAWSQTLGLADPVNCQLDPAFADEKAEFLAGAALYAGISEDSINQIILSRLEIDRVRAIFSAEFTNPNVPVVQTRHIRLSSQEAADAVLARLNAGEDFSAVMAETTEDSIAANNGDTLALATGGVESGYYPQGRMLPPINDAVFGPTVGEVIGPVAVGPYFLVIKIDGISTRPLQGELAETARAEHVNTAEAAMLDSYNLDLSENFQASFVPDDPMPGVVDQLLLPLDGVYNIENPNIDNPS